MPAPWSGPVLTSYAQAAEDIRLWRALSSKADGFYVDVGAGHPVTDSVTKLFYDAGWCGINIEPGPHCARLARERPRDVNLELAIAPEPGSREFWISSPDPGLSSFRPPDEPLPEAFTFRPKTVPVTRLDAVLDRHAAGRAIDFLKIDVEGAEREVLTSFDPAAVRPRIVVVEAISPLTHRPAHADWEPLLLEAGYLHAVFDGINRFYVSTEHAELIEVLAYPISPLDRYQQHTTLIRHAIASDMSRELERLRDPDHPPHVAKLESHLREARALIDDMERSLSWRLTRPLRAARRAQVRIFAGWHATRPSPAVEVEAVERAFVCRVRQATTLLARDSAGSDPDHGISIDEALARLAATISTSAIPAEAIAWLCLVAVTGGYPEEPESLRLTGLLRRAGPEAVTRSMRHRFGEHVASDTAVTSILDVVRDAVVVDATLAVTSDLQRGIHRVAREAVSRWIEMDPSLCLAHFDEGRAALRRVADWELERLHAWRSQGGVSHERHPTVRPEEVSADTLVPWGCRLVVVELLAPRHSRAIASLRSSRVNSLCAICFDLIPLVTPELVPRGLSIAFLDYLTTLKKADRVSTISHQTAADLHAFATMLRSEGRVGPEIAAHPLPTVPPLATADGLARTELDPRGKPLVVVVGPHETRKNHLAVLEAAERLWGTGLAFELLFVGTTTFDSELGFDTALTGLAEAGRPVHVTGPASEAELWSAYRAARFSVFPSLIEGFGLPIAESLAVGTPVITTSYGSMAEIAEGGGALLVDPANIGDLQEQMRRLLTDNQLHQRLRREALARDFGSWDDYAEDVWEFFTRDPTAASQ